MKYLLLLTLLITIESAMAECTIHNSAGGKPKGLNDFLSSLFSQAPSCPADVRELKTLLLTAGNTIKHAMVANRGMHNPDLGSFSFFEEVTGREINPGQFFFGHFTGIQNGTLSLEQGNAKGTLMVELIVWDKTKQFFNFYELIGIGNGSQWFYRGDSADILADNQKLFLTANQSMPKFGNRLRCSGCHLSGGPIMKEIELPHNDWWTKDRPLEFGALKFSSEVNEMVKNVLTAENFSASIKNGIETLENSGGYQSVISKLSLPE